MKLYLNDILAKRDMSVNELHKITKISRTTLDPLSKSEYLPPKTRFDTLLRISDGLQIPINDLINFEEDNTQKFKPEIVTVIDNYFDGYIREYLDRVLLKVSTNDLKHYLLMVTVKFSPDAYFDEKYKKEIEQMEEKFDEIRNSNDPENRKTNSEFEDLVEIVKKEGYSYKGKKVFSTKYAFFVWDISKYSDNRQLLPSKYIDLYKKSSNVSEIIGNDKFINSVSSFISELYDLKNNICERYFDSYEKNNGDVTSEYTNYVIFNYSSDNDDIEKNIAQKYYF